MIDVFEVLAHAPLESRARLVDALHCLVCGATLMRGRLFLGETAELEPHILCVACGTDAVPAARESLLS